MREQHTAKVIEGTADAPKERVIVPAEKKFGFVAVAAGEGLKTLFTDLGADVVVQGGQTMNRPPTTFCMLSMPFRQRLFSCCRTTRTSSWPAEQAVHISEEKR